MQECAAAQRIYDRLADKKQLAALYQRYGRKPKKRDQPQIGKASGPVHHPGTDSAGHGVLAPQWLDHSISAEQTCATSSASVAIKRSQDPAGGSTFASSGALQATGSHYFGEHVSPPSRKPPTTIKPRNIARATCSRSIRALKSYRASCHASAPSLGPATRNEPFGFAARSMRVRGLPRTNGATSSCTDEQVKSEAADFIN